MAKKSKVKPLKPLNWMPTAEDRKLMQDIGAKFGLNPSNVIRMSLRALAEKEGISQQ